MRQLLVTLAGFTLIASAPADVAIDDLAWLSGRWESQSGDRWVEETWSAPRGGTMFAFSRTGSGGALREFEFVRIERGADGILAYLASPGGRSPIAFTLTEADQTQVTFENPAHDYPQRIRYEREGESLRATISKSDGSEAASWSFRRLP